jgi:hypothetical protein
VVDCALVSISDEDKKSVGLENYHDLVEQQGSRNLFLAIVVRLELE